jgi:IS5 family transposase
MIGHMKSDGLLNRNWLKGALGDAIHAVLCAAGFNLRWLLRAVARMGITALFLFLSTALAVVGFLNPKFVAPRQTRRLEAAG